MPGYSHAVPPPLRRYVESCVGYDFRLAEDAVHHGLPSPALTLIFQFDAPLDAAWGDGSQRARYDVLLSGLHTRPALIRTHGLQRGIQLALRPAGARLFGMPAAALAETLCAGEDVAIPNALHARMQETDWPRRFALLDELLLWRAARVEALPPPELQRAWQLLTRSASPRVESVANAVGWSRRHLQARFRDEFGIAPKQAVRVARLGRARALLEAGFPAADAAARAGYADQPHLVREFRSLGGLTPGQLADNFPILQDAPV